MKSHYWKLFCVVLCCTSIYTPSILIGMNGDNDDLNDDLEAGHYFTLQNTQVSIITGESVGNFILQNTHIQTFNPQHMSALDLIRNLSLKPFNNLTQQDITGVLNGANSLYDQQLFDQFSFHRIDLTSPLALGQIRHALGNTIGQYFWQTDRPYGFNIIIFLRNQTELWICEIPSSQEIKEAQQNGHNVGNNDQQSPFSGKEKEVLKAMEMFEPLLGKLFIEGRSQELQERRKALWSCCKGSAVILVIIVVAVYMFIGATSGLISAVNSINNTGNSEG